MSTTSVKREQVTDTVGVLIVGLNGATANTLVTGLATTSEYRSVGSVIANADIPIFEPTNLRLVFGGWDIQATNAAEVARKHAILPASLIDTASSLTDVTPYRAIVGAADTIEARNAEYTVGVTDLDAAIALVMTDIADFRRRAHVRDCVLLILASPPAVTTQVAAATSAVAYAIAAARSQVPVVDFTPSPTLSHPDVVAAFSQSRVPYAGRDGNTGQSFLKMVISEALRIRNLRLRGWYSANILGNNDGRVLARPEHAVTKLSDKRGVIAPILGYSDFEHEIDITFYAPRGDNKESWDVVDFDGWLGLPMSLRLNWHGRDSILAAPLLLDLVYHMTHASRCGHTGVQEHLALYFKHPLGCGVLQPSEAFNNLAMHYALCCSKEI
jgi:myo-inositol-1-phosphate synthase